MRIGIAFGLAVGAGVQAFRAWPPLHPVTTDAAVLVLIIAILCAYLGGRWHGSGRPMAVAMASAEATAVASAQQSVQVAVVMPGGGAGGTVGGVRVPADDVAWFASEQRHALTESDLEGVDLSDLFQEGMEVE